MSDVSIAYDIRLENKLKKVKLQIWINEELQLQSEEQRVKILKSLSERDVEQINL
jgi:hypothetical protein